MIVLVFILGLAIGSFLNAYIWRLSISSSPLPNGERVRVRGKSVWRGRSICPKCKKTLQWFELIPLLSFVIQCGRCRGCKQKIDWQYPIVELVAGILFVLVFQNVSCIMYQVSCILTWLKYFYFIAILLVLFVYDLRYGLIPDRVVLPAIAIALAYGAGNQIWLFTQNGSSYKFIHYTLYIILAAAIGAAFFAIQHYLSRGRWVGAGDIRFGALMGAMLGWPQVLIGLLISYLVGGVVAAVLLLAGQKKFGQTVPMGTFLAIGTIITLLYGKQILRIYLPV